MSGVTASFFICTDDFGSSVAGSSVGTALQTLLPEFFCTTTYVRPPQQNTRVAQQRAIKDWHEATDVCAAEGKVLCGVDKPCSRSGCMYDLHYQWTGEECQAGDAGLPAAC